MYCAFRHKDFFEISNIWEFAPEDILGYERI
jgi:hypothetical protein